MIMFNGLLYVMQEIKVKNIIIGKQYEICENYKKMINIAKVKNINIKEVEAGQKINIEKNLYLDILWPSSNEKISDNILNNNSLMCKLVYKNFSVMFTGDIEEIAEKAILKKYFDKNILESTILKVAHHGSKTSTSSEFLKEIKPKFAVIEVGKNNNFGHPSKEIIERLTKIKTKIYRTDENGEISIKTNGKNIKIKTCIKFQ